MKRGRCSSFLFIIALLAGAVACNRKEEPQVFYNKEYLEALSTSRSAYYSDKNSSNYNNYVLAYVSKDEDKLNIALSGWHLSYGYIIADLNGKPEKVKYPIPGVSRVVSTSNNQLSITIDNRIYDFERVENIKSFVTSRTLAGTYTGSDNQNYSFSTDGIARFPEGSFDFEVERDSIWTPEGFDRMIYDHNKYLGFKWEEGKLKLYKNVMVLGSSEGSEFREPPMVVLTPTKAK